MAEAIKDKDHRRLKNLLKKHGVPNFELLLETAIAVRDPNSVKLLIAAAEEGDVKKVFPKKLLFSKNVVLDHRVIQCWYDNKHHGCGRKCTEDHLDCDCKWVTLPDGRVIGPYRGGNLKNGRGLVGRCTYAHQGEHSDYDHLIWGDWEFEVVNMLLKYKTKPTTDLVCCAWRNQSLDVLEKALTLGYKPGRKLCSYILKSILAGNHYRGEFIARLAEDVDVLRWFLSTAPTLRRQNGVDLADLLIPESKEPVCEKKIVDLLGGIKENAEFRGKLLTRFWSRGQEGKLRTLLGCGIVPNRRLCEKIWRSLGVRHLEADLKKGGIIRDLIVSATPNFFKVSIHKNNSALATILLRSEFVCDYDRHQLMAQAKDAIGVRHLFRTQLRNQLALFKSVLVALGFPDVLVEIASSYLEFPSVLVEIASSYL